MDEVNASIRTVTVAGVGLLGGSIGLALRAAGFEGHIAGVGRRQSSLADALEIGAIDSATCDPAEGAKGADLIILATPVGAFETLMSSVKPTVKRGATVTDVGSTKAEVVRLGQRIFGRGGPFVGSHPMAGTENRGPAFARADLFVDATCVVTPTDYTPPAKVRRIEGFWRALGMHTVRMGPAAHDKAVAHVSHLPHLVAALLTMLPADGDMSVAATGFRDATRMASGDPQMWRDILLTNRREILRSIKSLDGDLSRLAKLVDTADPKRIEAFFASAKTRRDATIGRRLTDRRVSAE
ncbi:MAG: prephenate dehydrogenase [Planctomycetota bacterium]|jgi:prephenate dehydrogenase